MAASAMETSAEEQWKAIFIGLFDSIIAIDADTSLAEGFSNMMENSALKEMKYDGFLRATRSSFSCKGRHLKLEEALERVSDNPSLLDAPPSYPDSFRYHFFGDSTLLLKVSNINYRAQSPTSPITQGGR